jgi:hypothetical protein
MGHSGSASAVVGVRERRASKRSVTQAKGKLFFPLQNYEEECTVCDLSADGARLKASCSVPLGSLVVLYVDGLGRFEGIVIQRDRRNVGLQFKQTESKRQKIAVKVAEFVEGGVSSPTVLRSAPRVAASIGAHHFTLSTGVTQPCEFIDIAISGASIKTELRPVVGETILFDGSPAVVVRHLPTGIAVAFLVPENTTL